MHTKLACFYKGLIVVALAFGLLPAHAQDSTAFAIGFSYQASAFPLVGRHVAAPVCVEPGTAKVVSIAAASLQHDINDITGLSPAVQNQLPTADGYAVVIGTLGNGGWIDDLNKKGRLRAN